MYPCKWKIYLKMFIVLTVLRKLFEKHCCFQSSNMPQLKNVTRTMKNNFNLFTCGTCSIYLSFQGIVSSIRVVLTVITA